MYVNKDLPPHLGGHDNETHLDNGVLDYMISKYKVESYLDVGCGPGGMVELAASKGLSVLGIDGDFTLNHKEKTLIHDYTKGPADIVEKFDMAWSCEFLEHVEEKYMPYYMDSFKKAKYVVCTYAVPGQWGHHHVNCQTMDYWKQKFSDYGFKFSATETLKLREASTMPAVHFKRSGMFLFNLNP
jgi:SAM-dependent methyltransferase